VTVTDTVTVRRRTSSASASTTGDCYPAAQASLLHTIAEASGCVVVLTGDMHFSDIKMLDPILEPAARQILPHLVSALPSLPGESMFIKSTK